MIFAFFSFRFGQEQGYVHRDHPNWFFFFVFNSSIVVFMFRFILFFFTYHNIIPEHLSEIGAVHNISPWTSRRDAIIKHLPNENVILLMIFSGGNKLHIQNWMLCAVRSVADLRTYEYAAWIFSKEESERVECLYCMHVTYVWLDPHTTTYMSP